jgi:hypothetical protein
MNVNGNAPIGAGIIVGADATVLRALQAGARLKTIYTVECLDKHGKLKWRDVHENIVTNAGLNDLLDKYLKGSAYTAAWYVGLTDGTPTVAAGDTMASHAGWAEITAFTEGARPALTLGTVASQSVDNSASKATFSINADSQTIGGSFLATNSTKGGSTGILYSVAAYTAGDKSLDTGDTLNVTATLTAASA